MSRSHQARRGRATMLALLALPAVLARAGEGAADAAALREARSAGRDWPTYAGSYGGQRHSGLAALDAGNVAGLALRWRHLLESRGRRLQTTALAIGGRLYVTDPDGGVIALDAARGVRLWRFAPEVPGTLSLCCSHVNRGAAALGTRLYVATIDARLVCLEAASGRMLWQRTLADHRAGYSSTGAPLALGDLVVAGIAGGEFRTRGFVAAYDAASGALRWRFHTIPAPGEAGHRSWAGESWRAGGAPTWITGSYDPQLELIFWGTGNPAPDYDASVRRGDNLYANSLLALHARTGRLAWHFQYTPADDHDWDGVQVPVLAELPARRAGAPPQRAVLVANRNGFFYVLDRTTGRLLRAAPFARQTWAHGLTRRGRPIVRLEASPSPAGTLVHPGRLGATNWWPPAYDPQRQLLLVVALERGGIFFREVPPPGAPGEPFLAGRAVDAPGPWYLAIRALDARSGRRVWEHRFAARAAAEVRAGGLLSTAGGLVFTSDDQRLVALDAASGRQLWAFDTGAAIYAPPVTYEADGTQLVSVAAGGELLTFGLEPRAPAARLR